MVLPQNTLLRQKAYTYLTMIEGNLPLSSTDVGQKGALYTRATGYTQAFLVSHWDRVPQTVPPDSTTSCNAFAGEFVRTELKGPFVGGFYIDTGFAYAWIASGPDVLPQYGDICLHADRGHLSVVIDLDPIWVTLQGGFGQSGRKTRVDNIGVGLAIWDYTQVLGWLDLDKLFPQRPSVPQWIKGWWKVSWDDDVYYYFFRPDFTVQWTYTAPPNAQTIQVTQDGGEGKFSVDGTLLVNWRSGSVEQFWYGTSDTPMEFWGKHNGDGVLHVERMT